MKFFLSKWALCFLGLLMLACSSCGPKKDAVKGPVEAEEPGVIVTRPLETEPVVPAVVGQTAPDAMAAIVAVGDLTLGTFTYEHSDAVALGQVIAQRPPGGRSVPAGSSVRLVISLGPRTAAEETPLEKPVVEKPTETPIEKPTETPIVQKPTDGPDIVARIGEYTFTKQELESRLVTELRVRPEECMNEDGTVNPEPALLRMLGEKAMIVDARQQKLLEKDNLALRRFNRFKKEVLAGLLWRKEVGDKIEVSEAEIDAKIKSDPKLKGNRAQARKVLAQAKERTLTEQYYKQLYEKLNVQKVTDNLTRAARIYRRLLIESRETEKLVFVRRKQVEALPPEEKNMVLAKFEGGQVTLEDLLWVLHGIGPNSRPRDLHTPKGMEKFLDRIMRQPVFVAEAKLQGLDKQEGYLKPVREREDRELRGKAVRAAYDQVGKPTEDELRPYFDANKDKFDTPDRLKIDQIWCQDLATAQKAKAELSSGKDFASVKQAYSLAKKEKALSTSASREGMFFEQLWNAGPNEIVGPIKGFYVQRRARQAQWQIKWRIVKILAKTPSKGQEYSSSIEEKVSDMIRSERRAAALIKHQEDLLQKHSYKIYHERIKDINPLNIP
jgi:peptidyl-prolyl cis-trans isomerase C